MLPELTSLDEVQQRLLTIFPEGVPNRGYLVRKISASVVYTMLYVGAVEGNNIWLGPKHVYCMSNEQARLTADTARLEYGQLAWKPKYASIGQRWYADTTRESIRDETLREGLIQVDAAIQRKDLPTTSSWPRYALRREFAALFAPSLVGTELDAAIEGWRNKHLSRLALARMALLRRGATQQAESVVVTLPNGSIRQVPQGPSSIIMKAVVEEFAPRYLYDPAVVLMSESGEKILLQEAALSEAIGLQIMPDRLLPDVVLFDLHQGKELLVFVEIVASDGPVSVSRKSALLAMAIDAGIPETQVAFVTAYRDRNDAAFKKTFEAVAWNTLIWFMSEPNQIVVLHDQPTASASRIFDLLA